MFNENEEWSDEQDVQPPSPAVCKDSQKKNSTNVKSKVVGKKSLLRTLETLGSMPEWKDDKKQQDSDSDNDTEAAPSPVKKKRKKKRSKRGKNTNVSEEQQQNGDLQENAKEEKLKEKQISKSKPMSKSKKPVARKIKTTSAGEPVDQDATKSAKTDVNNADGAEKLSRKQWKNKMKNKRKCKNKFKKDDERDETESAAKPEPKEVEREEMKTVKSKNKPDEVAASEKKKETERKPQKRKQAAVDADISHVSETQKENRANGGNKKAAILTDDQAPSPEKKVKLELSKEQSLKRKKLREMLQEKDQQEVPSKQKDGEPATAEPTPAEEPPAAAAAAAADGVKVLDRSASLRLRMEQRLESGRFRYINEQLYSTTSGEARRMFKQDPEAFWVYHRGYTAQVQRWPTNPVDAIINYIQLKPSHLVVADFGCGDCKIARSVKNKVHSFDLAPACDLVTVCDMANVPLADGSVDIAVFCLSLMGTNLGDFLAEANRVLKMRGVLKIAEVTSRFENVRAFITALANLGFKLVSKDTENTHFSCFECTKTGSAPENRKTFGLTLRPCMYKKR